MVALIGSYFFYAWGAPRFVLVLAATTIVNYGLSRWMAHIKDRGQDHARRVLILALILNVALLAYAKYANFFVHELNAVLSAFGWHTVFWTNIVLPIGISFFTFQQISYLVDVYRGTVPPAARWTEYALYVVLFPQLIAGPIVRYHDVAEQIRERVYDVKKFSYGIYRFCLGLGKKVLIANQLGVVADAIFGLSLNHTALPVTHAWLGLLAYGMQIYFDFSGYSDMAIGLGNMLGFRFLENFRMPYIATSFTDFWRRWHISLSNWMKEYLYIPLGGNRVALWRRYLNLWFVFLLSGLWHGANWTFIVWGAYHGFFLMLDKLFLLRALEKIPLFLARSFTFGLVLIGWVFFRSPNLTYAGDFLVRLFSFRFVGDIVPDYVLAEFVSSRSLFTLGVALCICFIPGWKWTERVTIYVREHASQGWKWSLKYSISFVLFLLSVLSLANSSFNPFIYFQF